MQVLFVFLDNDPRNLYQLRQWIQPLTRLSKSHDVSVVYASDIAAADIEVSGLPTYRVDLGQGLLNFLAEHEPQVLLYPNQNTLNFYANRYSRGIHVWVSHGESDKAYMSQNTLKRYDLYFAAGEVARQRVLQRVEGYSPERIKLIGRPQLADEHQAPAEFSAEASQGLQVLYAPTWEGATSATQYGSIATHGEAIVRKLIELGHRVIYRPHPLSGSRVEAVATADAKIRSHIEWANSRGGQHFVDKSEFGWQLKALDFMITDVSAVAYDWLATDKPMLITMPQHPDAVLPEAPLFEALKLIEPAEVDDLGGAIDAATGSESQRATMARLRTEYFAQGDADQLFRAAIEQALALRKTLSLNRGAAAKTLKVFARRAAWLRELLRYPSYALRIALKAVGVWVPVSQTPPAAPKQPLRNLYVHFSDAFEVRSLVGVANELFEIAKADGEVYLATNQVTTLAALKAHFWWHGRNVGAASKPKIHLFASTSSPEAEILLKQLAPERALYLKDHPNNLMLLRLNGVKHLLYRPESDRGFEPTHSLTMYDVVVTNATEAQDAIKQMLPISRPELQKFAAAKG